MYHDASGHLSFVIDASGHLSFVIDASRHLSFVIDALRHHLNVGLDHCVTCVNFGHGAVLEYRPLYAPCLSI